MSDHTIKKPSLFISHATSDAAFANAVKQEIGRVFANGVDVFCTSSPGAISAGVDWLSSIEQRLAAAQAVIAIVTPVSIERPWLWFEIGATWSKGRAGDCRIYPLCVAEVELSSLPAPLDRLQALSLGKADHLKQLIQALIDQFGFGQISSFRATNITKNVPKYKDVKLAESDQNARRLYSGRYTGYSDEELMEVIDTGFVHKDEENLNKFALINDGREDVIHNGKLIHYNAVDSQLDLPPGTARRLLARVAARYGLKPTMQTDNIARFGSS